MKRLRVRWGLYAVVGMLVLLILGELYARYVVGLGDPPLTVTHPTMEYLFKPEQDCQRLGNRVVINGYGMRSKTFPPRKGSDDEFRVMVYGDSILNGGNTTDQSELATTLLEPMLEKELDRPVVVGNISAGSWGPANQLAHLREYGDFQADAAILLLSAQDVMDVPTFEPIDEVFLPTQKPVSALWEGVERYLLPRVGIHRTPTLNRIEPNVFDPVLHEQVQRDLTALIQALRAGGRPVGVVRWWYPGDGARIKTRIEDEQAVGDLLALVEANGAIVLDLRSRLQGIHTATGLDPIYRDGLHPNSAGQCVLAEALEEMTNRLLGESPAQRTERGEQ
jgi:lysophospholipase L1-like esterase